MNKYIEKIKEFFSKIKFSNTSKISISSKDKINLLEQLSNLLNSGIPLVNSFKIIMYQTKDKKLKNLVKELIEKLNKGDSLKDAFSNYDNIFNIFDLSIIEMGEVTGKLGNSIETIKIKEEKSRELKTKIIGALIYPMVIVGLSLAMILVFMIYVIPKITDMYKDAKVNLPELTQNVIDVSDFLQKYVFEIIVLLIIFIISFIIFKKNPRTKIYYDKAILYVPIFGPLIKKKILSLFTSSLGILLTNGVIINKSLEISARALDNDYYSKELSEIINSVSRGKNLSSCMGIDEIQTGKENFLFPIELASVIKIGEETGKLAELLTKISKKYSKQIDELVKNMQTAIEPIVIVVVGAIIGTLIMAIMLPFFNMVNVI
ncbi:MAG: type II secretion system F family protein [Candidatus Gracilibacteria bacterium]|nr:type II secretion system F family protein [Candidatus Gracilibacteria bacterium]